MRKIEQRKDVPAHIGHTMDRVAVTLRVEVCGPSSGRTDGKPSREPWPEESVIVIAPSVDDDEAWERFHEVEEIKIPLDHILTLVNG